MKSKVLLLISSYLLLTTSYGQVLNNLVVFCNDGEKFSLIINGQKYNSIPSTNIKATDLTFKKYDVKIIFENKKLSDVNTTITFFSTNTECVFGLIKHSKKKYKLEYVSSAPINGAVSNTATNIQTNNSSGSPNNSTYSTSGTGTGSTSNTNTSGTNSTSNNNSTVSVNTMGVNIGMNDHGGVKIGTKEGSINLDTHNKSGNVSLGSGSNAIVLHKAAKTGCPTPLSYAQFDPLKKNITTQTTEESKLTAAEKLVEGNCLTTSEVKELMQQLKEDSSRIELAKKAYLHTNDLSNYYQLKEEITSEDKKKELHEFIHNNQK